MLKHIAALVGEYAVDQPPSGGCVLKLTRLSTFPTFGRPAAFRRLCVETHSSMKIRRYSDQPPSGGCVLKQSG